MSDPTDSNSELLQLRIRIRDLNIDHWLHHDLFSFNWWLIFAVSLLYMIVWWKLVDRTRLVEIVLYGAMIALASIVMDICGVSLILWSYPDKMFPVFPPFFIVDMTQLPVSFMVLYQFFPRGWPFVLANVAASGILSFLIEPALVALGIYQMHNWHYTYSFPLYIAMGLCLRLLHDTLLEKATTAKNQA